ncbi:MAG: ParA family protein [Arenicellales bacterium]|nr:ParA family protein [Arenicellales bacterium]
MSSKGGVGKSTLSSNLASYCSFKGRTALCDLDRQKSGVRWLQRRDPSRRKIDSLTDWASCGNGYYDWIVIDPPAALTGADLKSLVLYADAIVVPVLPSPIDILAAADFIRELVVDGKVFTLRKPLAVVANRARANTLIYRELRSFLQSLKLPFATTLRDSQNYIRASTQGVGIFEMDSKIVARDVEQWQPLLQWIKATTGQKTFGHYRPARSTPGSTGERNLAGAIHKLYKQ